MARSIRVGLAGFGSSAKTFHLPFLQSNPRFQVVSVWERQAKEAPSRVPGAQVHREIDDFMGDLDWELGVIALPNELHASTALRVLESGRPVVVEKPMTATSVEAQALLDAAARRGVPGFVFQNRRLDGDWLLVQDLVRERRLGRLVRIECRYDRWANALRKKAWKEQGTIGNSLLEDLGSHLVDQVLTLLGQPQRLQCRLGIQRDGSQTPDAFRISLDYGGLWVDLEAGMVVRHPAFHWRLDGTAGTFEKRGMDPQEAQLLAGVSPLDPLFGVEDPELAGWLFPSEGPPMQLETPRGRYSDFYANVADVLLDGKENEFPLDAGAAVVRILELCQTSAKEGRTLTL